MTNKKPTFEDNSISNNTLFGGSIRGGKNNKEQNFSLDLKWIGIALAVLGLVIAAIYFNDPSIIKNFNFPN